jgi:hypothetical protein
MAVTPFYGRSAPNISQFQVVCNGFASKMVRYTKTGFMKKILEKILYKDGRMCYTDPVNKITVLPPWEGS